MQQRGGRPGAHVVRRVLGLGALAGALLAGGLVPLVTAPAVASGVTTTDAPADADDLYLVTLAGPGTAGATGVLPDDLVRLRLAGEQQQVLDSVGAPEPVYRWTTALNGFAVRLTHPQAVGLAARSEVALVERDAVRRLAAAPRAVPASAPASLARAVGGDRTEGGAGVVIGIVDSGIAPEGPVFADVNGLGRRPTGFRGGCSVGEDWSAEECTGKLVGARWFVDGFGADRVRTSASLSPRDDDGHGTQMASIAAGNPGVTVRVRGQRIGRYAGLAPQARLATYKACWTAPDPHDDGCATADLVAAIDSAVEDGVDVLNLSVAGSSTEDTVERALLGAAEADVVVIAAAGNNPARPAAHVSPWVTTVGGSSGVVRRGRVVLGARGPRLTGAMASTRAVGPARLVVGGRVAARGSSRAAARLCTPGSLDASRVGGAVVICERGGIGRVDKSASVRRADGVGMVLVNDRPGSVDSDFHSVPTVHLGVSDARSLRRWQARHPDGRVTLRPLGADRSIPGVVGWSSGGDPAGAVLKPDVVAPAAGALGAVPPAVRGVRWDFVSGTSSAAAYTSGAAATLLSAQGWSAATVRSALATTASSVRGRLDVLRSGAGRLRPERATDPGLVYRVPRADYRAWLDGTLGGELNTPSIVVRGDGTATRTITNVGRRALYFSSSARGFDNHRVVLTPAAVRLAPGESATYTLTVTALGGRRSRSDDGYVTWRGARGTVTRIPVLLTR